MRYCQASPVTVALLATLAEERPAREPEAAPVRRLRFNAIVVGARGAPDEQRRAVTAEDALRPR